MSFIGQNLGFNMVWTNQNGSVLDTWHTRNKIRTFWWNWRVLARIKSGNWNFEKLKNAKTIIGKKIMNSDIILYRCFLLVNNFPHIIDLEFRKNGTKSTRRIFRKIFLVISHEVRNFSLLVQPSFLIGYRLLPAIWTVIR